MAKATLQIYKANFQFIWINTLTSFYNHLALF